jgi:hypothetical protein
VDYDDYDEVVVERIMTGARIGCPIAAADAAEAVRRLVRDGYHDGQIALKLGFNRRSVLRIRRRLGIPATLPIGGNQYTCVQSAPSRPRILH